MYKLIFLLLLCSHCFSCPTRINIASNASVSLTKLVEQVAQMCNLSVLYANEHTKSIMDKKKSSINIYNKPLNVALDIILNKNDFHYKLTNDTLEIGFLQTRTFDIHYIATTRVGSSNTDIVFSQEPILQNQYGFNTLNNNSMAPISNFEIDNQAHKIATNKATATSNNAGKSGTKIYSIDEVDFWGDLANEISSIAYQPNDLYQPPDSELKDKNKKHIIINKAAGLLTITGSSSQLKRVENYLNNLNKKIQQQVLLDVNILNLTHTNNSTYGINWNELFNLSNVQLLPATATDNATNQTFSSQGNNYNLSVFSQGVSLNRIVEFLKTYGKVQSISNPKVLTINNQPAIISVGSVLRYTQSTTFNTTTQGTSLQNSSQQFPSVFAGILLDVTPSIKNDKIMLKINPSITKTKDIAVENQSTALDSPPNLSTKQLSSLVQVKDGQSIILGGLIDKTNSKITRKIPLLGDIPLLKYLFSYTSNINETQEMIIIITPKIIDLDRIDTIATQIKQDIDNSMPTTFKLESSKNIDKNTQNHIDSNKNDEVNKSDENNEVGENNEIKEANENSESSQPNLPQDN